VDSHAWGHVLRLSVSVLLIMVVGATFTVVRLHWKAWRMCPAKVGLTPLHVAAVSSGVLVWGLSLAWAMLDSLRQPITSMAAVRIGMYGAGAVLILTSLAIMASVQRRRVKFGRSHEQVTVTTTTTTNDVAVTADDSERGTS
jgi:hypothetical protein